MLPFVMNKYVYITAAALVSAGLQQQQFVYDEITAGNCCRRRAVPRVRLSIRGRRFITTLSMHPRTQNNTFSLYYSSARRRDEPIDSEAAFQCELFIRGNSPSTIKSLSVTRVTHSRRSPPDLPV